MVKLKVKKKSESVCPFFYSTPDPAIETTQQGQRERAVGTFSDFQGNYTTRMALGKVEIVDNMTPVING